MVLVVRGALKMSDKPSLENIHMCSSMSEQYGLEPKVKIAYLASELVDLQGVFVRHI